MKTDEQHAADARLDMHMATPQGAYDAKMAATSNAWRDSTNTHNSEQVLPGESPADSIRRRIASLQSELKELE